MNKASSRRTGTFAFVAGVIGILAVGLLIAALAAPTPAPTMRRETSLFAWQNAAVVLQAVLMIPVALGLSARALNGGRITLWIGLVGQIALALAAGLLLTGNVSDMLYMAPIGVVGIWLLLVNRRDNEVFSRSICWTGSVAGFGLLLVGIGFVIYGVFVAPDVFMRPLTKTEIDAQSLTTPNLIAHIFMAVGTLFGRIVYPIWTLALGRRLSRLGRN